MHEFRKYFMLTLLTIPYLLLSIESDAQVSLGLKGGINFSDIVIENKSFNSFSTRTAPTFGIIFNYQISPVIMIQAEPGFSMRGARTETVSDIELAPAVSYKVVDQSMMKINYFELPIMVQYRPQITEKLAAIISAGPEIRFLTPPQKFSTVRKTYIRDELAETERTELTLSRADGFAKFDFGLTAGAGLAYRLGRFSIFAEGRYHLGLYNVTPDSDLKTHNRGASVFLGITAPIVKR